MQTWYYVVVSIDGDYANLRRTDIESDDLKLVARALLPAGINEKQTEIRDVSVRIDRLTAARHFLSAGRDTASISL